MKKVLLGIVALGVTLTVLPMFAAFEAHVINVVAKIENALTVSLYEVDFGTVFPQEELDKRFDVALSSSFLDEDRVDDIEYAIRQKPKCWNGDEQNPKFGRVTENSDGEFYCVDGEYKMLPLLCPYLSKHEITEDGREQENDESINAFHGPISGWTLADTLLYQVDGRLAKSVEDTQDTWNIDLKTPCFGDHCAQDWEEFVHTINDGANPDDYIQPIENEHDLFGCDLWLEVFHISLPGFGCDEELDMMLVLDRSGSIGTDMQDLKDAANAFVTALAPSTAGVHIGQSSFSDGGNLDLHLTDVEADVHTAINALASAGFTNLKEGIELATGELDDADAHERPAVDDVMVIITDGEPNRPFGPPAPDVAAATAADAARADGTEVFVVGVGGAVNAAYLSTEIADDAAHYFGVANYADLEALLEDFVACDD